MVTPSDRYWYETRTPYSSCDMTPKGISTRVDWALMVPCMFGNPNMAPKTVILSERTLTYINYSHHRKIPSNFSFLEPPLLLVLMDTSCLLCTAQIFVHHYMISHFIESTLRFMDKSFRFVLLSGGSDITIPRSTDVRYSLLRGFAADSSGGAYYKELLKSPQLIHWFCEVRAPRKAYISCLPVAHARQSLCVMVGILAMLKSLF